MVVTNILVVLAARPSLRSSVTTEASIST